MGAKDVNQKLVIYIYIFIYINIHILKIYSQYFQYIYIKQQQQLLMFNSFGKTPYVFNFKFLLKFRVGGLNNEGNCNVKFGFQIIIVKKRLGLSKQ